MQFVKFGQTGLTVSRMILGTGTFGKQTDEREAHRMLDNKLPISFALFFS
jgi:1-deoxyxylulose-5-phosphate synthase